MRNEEMQNILSIIGKCKVKITNTINIENENAKLVLFDYSGECEGESAAIIYGGVNCFI